mgnify:CR=1 FL=1
MPNAPRLITRFAKQFGLDPQAVLAGARGEGGLRNRPGDIGDLSGGGSFGPFQLYTQGALPAETARRGMRECIAELAEEYDFGSVDYIEFQYLKDEHSRRIRAD